MKIIFQQLFFMTPFPKLSAQKGHLVKLQVTFEKFFVCFVDIACEKVLLIFSE